MRRKLVLSLGLLVLVLPLPPVVAGPLSGIPLQRLAGLADAVIVADIARADQTDRKISLGLEVQRVLKGTLVPGNIVSAHWEADVPRPSAAEVGPQRGLWFLSSDSQGYRVLPVMAGTLSFPMSFFHMPQGDLPSGLSYSKTAPVTDKLVMEIGFAIEGRGSLGPAYASIRLGEAFDNLSSPELTRLYRRFAESQSTSLRALGLGGLIRSGDIAALVRAEAERSDVFDTPEGFFLVSSVGSVFRNPDPAGVAVLGRLATSRSLPVSVQKAATYAMRVMHTRETLPFLVQQLDHPLGDIRYQAVAGLASFANIGHVPLEEKLKSRGQYVTPTRGPYTTDETLANFPGRPEFDQNESRYMQFWKQWARTVMGLPSP